MPAHRASCSSLAVVVAVVAVFVVVVTTTGCPFWPDHDTPAADDGALFLAQNADFADLAAWPTLVLDDGPVDGGHASASRTIRINALPAPAATAFATGTIVVKEGAGADGDEIHAMVKRGGGFNTSGARGWEFFELQRATDGTPLIAWRGEEPPEGEGYGCVSGSCTTTTTTSCNACHGSAFDNDFVLSPALTLGALDPRWSR